MGGTAYLIYGNITEERIAKSKKNQLSFFDKLFRKNKITSVENNDISTEDFNKTLKKQFLNFINNTIKKKWQATESIIEGYLSIDVFNTYIRKEKDKYYLQISFSGCAGQAETSSLISSHWFELWYKKNKEKIDNEIFIPFGFIPSHISEYEDEYVFFPLNCGYAICYCDVDNEIDAENPWLCPELEVDESVKESFGNDEEINKYSKIVKDNFSKYTKDKKCRCQICDPNFDITILNILPEWK